MAKNRNQGAKLLYILDYLKRNSDEEHPVTAQEIIRYLDSCGVPAERKSIYSDIEALGLFGYDIICQKGKNGGYYLASGEFELAELKLLVDCVQSSRFITEKKSTSLISKLEALTSIHKADYLHRQVHVFGRVKRDNEEIYYNVDKLERAINDGKKVSFKYAEYLPDKTKRFRNNGKDYVISPYCLTFSDDNYYVVAYYEKYGQLTNFRVDRISGVKILNEPVEELKDEKFDLAGYLKQSFDMFSGETKSVTMECDNSLVNSVIDRFGDNVFMRKISDNAFSASADVKVSPTFFSWVFMFGGRIRITSPSDVAAEYKKMVSDVLSLY